MVYGHRCPDLPGQLPGERDGHAQKIDGVLLAGGVPFSFLGIGGSASHIMKITLPKDRNSYEMLYLILPHRIN